jgi:hypothetical protein
VPDDVEEASRAGDAREFEAGSSLDDTPQDIEAIALMSIAGVSNDWDEVGVGSTGEGRRAGMCWVLRRWPEEMRARTALHRGRENDERECASQAEASVTCVWVCQKGKVSK